MGGEALNLFSAKDLDRVEKAMAEKEQISLTRTMGDVSQTVSTSPATPVWGCPMLVRLEKTKRNLYSTQYFKSVKEMEESL